VPCELCERPAGDAYLCGRCAATWRRAPGAAARAVRGARRDARAGPAADGGGRSRHAVEAPLPLRPTSPTPAASSSCWRCGRGRSPPTGRRPRPRPTADDLGARVTAACAALVAAVGWIGSSWPAAGDCAREVRDLYDGARSVVGAADLPARMGRCPQLVHGAACGAELLLPSGQQVLRCQWCGATYPPGVWAALKVAQRGVQPFGFGGRAGSSSVSWSATAGSRG
jgi:hypothetical protein